MIAKMIEIRDRGTCMPALAIRCVPEDDAERWLLQRAGFGSTANRQSAYVLLTPLTGSEKGIISYDPFKWQLSRTLHEAHLYLIEHYDEVSTCGVVDVEYILSETDKPKISERLEDENNSGA